MYIPSFRLGLDEAKHLAKPCSFPTPFILMQERDIVTKGFNLKQELNIVTKEWNMDRILASH